MPDAPARPTRPRRTAFDEAERDAVDRIAVPQSGPIISSPLPTAEPLQLDLVLDRHIVAEEKDGQAALARGRCEGVARQPRIGRTDGDHEVPWAGGDGLPIEQSRLGEEPAVGGRGHHQRRTRDAWHLLELGRHAHQDDRVAVGVGTDEAARDGAHGVSPRAGCPGRAMPGDYVRAHRPCQVRWAGGNRKEKR